MPVGEELAELLSPATAPAKAPADMLPALGKAPISVQEDQPVRPALDEVPSAAPPAPAADEVAAAPKRHRRGTSRPAGPPV